MTLSIDMNPELLLSLADRCEKATGPDRELERAIKAALEGRAYISFQDDLANRNGATPPRYTASLDAAMTLVDPSWFFHVSRFSPDNSGRSQAHVYPNRIIGDDYEAEAATPALALTAASLRARAALSNTRRS